MTRAKRLLSFLAPTLLLSAAAQTSSQSAPRYTSSATETANGYTLRVDALTDSILRVRLYPAGHPAENASWAVLPSARAALVSVALEAHGFSTAQLHVRIAPDLSLTITNNAGNNVQQDAAPPTLSGTSFHLHKSMDLSDHFFGLGDKPGPLDRRGSSYVMWNTDHFGWQESTDPIYKSIPFFLNVRKGGRTVGVLVDNTFRSFFDFGHEIANQYSFGAPDGPIDYYILYGPEPKQVVEEYAWLTGPTPLPPLWALGYQQSRYSYYPQSQAEEIAARFRTDHIPVDALYLDIDYQDRNRPFTVSPTGFPDFPGFVKKIAAENFHLVLITDLHIADLPNQGYAPYDSGEAGDHFVKENGKDFAGTVWPGMSVFPDFTRQQTRAWWGTLYTQFVADGVAGFWNDMNEPAVFSTPDKTMPANVVHRIDEPAAEGFAPRTAMDPEIHNIYGMQNSRGTWDGALALQPNVRPFVLTRASYAGGQRYASTWTGDNLATWNHLRQTTPQLLNLGLSGFAMSGADYGFGSSPAPDLLTRWFEVATFQPIDRNHSAKGTNMHEPWVDGPEQEAIRRRYIEERYKLMPYLYTTAEEMSRTGLPIVRPLFLEFPHAAADGHPVDTDGGVGGQFMFGAAILVAYSPLPDDVAAYTVRLPPGLWYDYWNGTRLDRHTAAMITANTEILDAPQARLAPIKVQPKLDVLPVYVRAGAIVPIAPLTQSTNEIPTDPLTLRVFPPAAPGDDCHGEVYTDDGKSYDFRKGVFAREKFTCTIVPGVGLAGDTLTVSIGAREGSYKPWWHALRIEVVGRQVYRDTPVSSGSKLLSPEKTALGIAVTVPDKGLAQTVTFH